MVQTIFVLRTASPLLANSAVRQRCALLCTDADHSIHQRDSHNFSGSWFLSSFLTSVPISPASLAAASLAAAARSTRCMASRAVSCAFFASERFWEIASSSAPSLNRVASSVLISSAAFAALVDSASSFSSSFSASSTRSRADATSPYVPSSGSALRSTSCAASESTTMGRSGRTPATSVIRTPFWTRTG